MTRRFPVGFRLCYRTPAHIHVVCPAGVNGEAESDASDLPSAYWALGAIITYHHGVAPDTDGRS